jgi:hypothetical protein
VRKTRRINGAKEVKVYAYRHQREPDRYGIRDGMSFDDVRRGIGRQFDLRAVWISEADAVNAHSDNELMKSIVATAFSGVRPLTQVACYECGAEFVGTKTQCQSARCGGRVYCSRKCQIKVAAKWQIRPARRANA